MNVLVSLFFRIRSIFVSQGARDETLVGVRRELREINRLGQSLIVMRLGK